MTTTVPATPQPQTAEQVIAGVLARHHIAGFGASTVNCSCGAVTTHEEYAAHQAAEVVAALGLREEWGVDIRKLHGPDSPIPALSETAARSLVARAKRSRRPVRRDVTDWRAADA